MKNAKKDRIALRFATQKLTINEHQKRGGNGVNYADEIKRNVTMREVCEMWKYCKTA